MDYDHEDDGIHEQPIRMPFVHFNELVDLFISGDFSVKLSNNYQNTKYKDYESI